MIYCVEKKYFSRIYQLIIRYSNCQYLGILVYSDFLFQILCTLLITKHMSVQNVTLPTMALPFVAQ